MHADIAFRPEDVYVLIFTYPKGQASVEIFACLEAKGIPKTNIDHINMRDTIAARNKAIRDMFLPSGKSWLLMIDADMKPGPATRRFWDADGDVVGAYYPLDSFAPWQNGSAHCGMLRATREVFETLPAPWFEIVRTPDGCQMTECECNYFVKRARFCGFAVTQAGYCEHGGRKDCSRPY